MQSQSVLCIGDIPTVRTYVREWIDAYLSGVQYDDDGYGYHANLLWIPCSARQQRRDDIQSIFTNTAYARSDDDPLFIVLEHADQLTHVAANSMLKLLEEPPAGYYIILIASSEDAVLPTITSRCHVYRYVSTHAYEHHPLYRCMTGLREHTMYDINTLLEEHVPTEHETRILLERLHTYWLHQYMYALQQSKRHRIRMAEATLNVIQTGIHYIPMSGNVKLFWRILVCQMHMIEESHA